MKEQQSGLGKNQDVRKLPPLTQQHMIAAERREAQRQTVYEAEIQEADESYSGHRAGIEPEHRPFSSQELTRLTHSNLGRKGAAPRAPVTFDAEGDYELEEDESYYDTRLPTSARRYGASPAHVYQQGNKRYHVCIADVPPGVVPPRKSRQAQLPPPHQSYSGDQASHVPPATRSKRRIHPLLSLGVGMLAMCALFLLLSSAATWVQQKQDDLIYGRPRTYQLDAVVGHNDSGANPSHFLALNLNRHVEVIEIPGGDNSKMRVYYITTLFGDGEDLTPVTLSFRDVTGDGKPDMLIHIERKPDPGVDQRQRQLQTCQTRRNQRSPIAQKRGKQHD